MSHKRKLAEALLEIEKLQREEQVLRTKFDEQMNKSWDLENDLLLQEKSRKLLEDKVASYEAQIKELAALSNRQGGSPADDGVTETLLGTNSKITVQTNDHAGVVEP